MSLLDQLEAEARRQVRAAMSPRDLIAEGPRGAPRGPARPPPPARVPPRRPPAPPAGRSPPPAGAAPAAHRRRPVAALEPRAVDDVRILSVARPVFGRG